MRNLALTLSCALLIAGPVLADPVTVSASDESGGKRLAFHWPAATPGTVAVNGRVLSVTFSNAIDTDLAKLADAMNGTGSFVRLSADHKTLSVTLSQPMAASGETSGTDFIVHLASRAPLQQQASGAAVPAGPPPARVASSARSAVAPPLAITQAPVPQATRTATLKPAASEPPKPASPPPKPAPRPATHQPAPAATSPAATAQATAAKPAPANAPPPKQESDPAPSTPQVAQPELTVSKEDDYTRLRFEFPLATKYTAELGEGALKLTFQSNQPVQLSELTVNPPPRVRSAQGKLANGVFEAKIGLTAGVTFRQNQEGNDIIIDLVDVPKPPMPDNSEAANAAPAPAEQHPPDAAPAPLPGSAPPEQQQANAAPPPAAAEAASTSQAPQAPQAPAPAQPQAAAIPSAPPGTIQSVLNIKDIDVSALDQRVKDPDSVEGDESANPEDISTVQAAAGEAPPVIEVPPVEFPVVITLGSDAARLSFGWGKPVPAAAVRRGERLWVAFGGRGLIDLSSLDALRDKGVHSYMTQIIGDATIVGMQLDERILATVVPQGNGWTVALGDSILSTAPDVPIEPRTDADAAELAAKLTGDLQITHFKDTDVEDDLIFVMSGPLAQGLVGTRRYVDFELLASAQGLAIRPIADSVDVRTEPGYALITKPGGLALSGTHMPGEKPAAIPPKPVKASPADMKLSEWRGPANVPFSVGLSARMLKASTSDKDERIQAQLDLVHYYMGNQMPQEALGILGVMAIEAPPITSDLHYRALRGIANLMAGRLDEAQKDLDDRLLPDDQFEQLWLGMLAAGEGDWPKARVRFAKAGPAIDKLDNPWQARARLAAAQAALGVNDVTNARMNLEFLQREGLTPVEANEAQFQDARLAEALGENDKALAAYEKLAKGPVESIAVKADLAHTRLAAKLNKITVDEAIDRLEALRFEWRGDAIEADTLLTLGKLYARLGDFRHALSTMKTAVRHFPGTPLEREITGEMYDMFEDLYLNGKADDLPPIQALGLYYDFKELTPIGPKGDVMIRRLSDRLVAMDLLDQATELLDYQVENRLRGVARSQVATRLALVQLMNHRAEDALRTINSTRQSRLPDTIAMQRRLIESRSLMDLKRYDAGLDVIDEDVGAPFDRLRADIYWHQDDWSKAGPALEQGLGTAWSDAPALNESQRFDVMRASIAYVLGGDKDGLARIAQEYMPKMKGTPDSHGFEVIVSDPGNANLELHSLAEKFASIDTLSAFLDDLKKEDVPAPPVATSSTPTN